MIMSDSFSLEPFCVLTKDMVSKSRFKVKPSASYRHNGISRGLLMSGGKKRTFRDETEVWDVNQNGIILTLECTWDDSKLLFSDFGISSESETLGVAFRVNSSDSLRKIVKNVNGTVIDYNSRPMKFIATLDLEPGTVRGKVGVELIVYRKSGPDPATFGEVVGVLWSTILLFETEGSLFPIETVDLGKETQLWELICEYEDPRMDPFDQCVLLRINTAHPQFKELKLDSNAVDTLAFQEIVSQAMLLLILELKSDDVFQDVLRGTGLDYRSIGSAVHYMIKSFNCGDSCDPIRVSNSIHDVFNKKGGESE